MTTGTDVVVVGAGVLGASIAHEFSRAGRRVVVVDKGPGVGHGSTSASSAVVRFNYSTEAGVALAWESYHCWMRWAEHLGCDDTSGLASLHAVGAVMLDVPVMQIDRTRALLLAAGVPCEVWDAVTLRERVPGIDPGRHWPPKRVDDDAFWEEPEGKLGALYMPQGGFVDDPMLAAQNLADAARRNGSTFRFGSRVVDVPRREGRVAGVVLESGETLEAAVVINAAGPWSAGLNALAGVGSDHTIDLRPMRQEVHHVPAPPGYNDRGLGPVVADLDLGTYLRPASGDGLMVGGSEPECDPLEWVDDPDAINPHRTKAQFDAQVLRAARRFPALAVPSQPSGIAGVYDVATDWTPVYDRTELDGFYLVAGTSGNQFKNAPVVGRLMATLVEAVEAGRDHDADPVVYRGEHTGCDIDLGAFSRRREIASTSGTVLG